MFKKSNKKEMETAYDRRRSLMFNRLMCIIVGGVLLYLLIQAFFEPEPMPLWFPIVMGALIIGDAAILVWNIRAVKEFDREQDLLAEQAEQEKLLNPHVEVETHERENDINDSPYDT